MIKIEMQETDLRTFLGEQARLTQQTTQQIIDANARLSNANAALTAEQAKHRVTSDKVYGLQNEIDSHKYNITNLKADLETAKKAPPDPSLVAVELTDLLTNIMSGKPNKIEAVRVIRALTGWGLKEARDLYEGAELKVATAKIKAA